MGGKTKQSQRTKNNARPSSSGRSAELLNNAASLDPSLQPGGGKMMSALFPTLAAPALDQGLTPEFTICIKKLNKKDPITKVKALLELSELVGKSNVDDVVAALPSWAHFYKVVAVDTDCKVREAAQVCQGAFARACGRRLAPALRQLVPAWLQAQHDDHAPAKAHATNSLKATFPESKLPEVISFCKAEVVAQLLDSLVGDAENTLVKRAEDSSERGLQLQRLATCSLQGLQYTAVHLPADQHDWLWRELAPLFNAASFWKYATHPAYQLRAAWFAAMTRVIGRFAREFAEKFGARMAKLMLAAAHDPQPLVAQQLWGCVLQYIYSVPEWHNYLDKKDLLTKRILDMLEKGGWGDAKRLIDMLLPLLAHLPQDMLTKNFYEAFFNAFFKGLEKKNVLNSKSERQYWVTSLSECLRYLSIQQNDYVVEVTTAVHRTWLETALSTKRDGQVRTNLIKHSATNMTALLKYWLKQSKEANGEKFDQLIRNFWQNVCSTMLSQIDKPVEGVDIAQIIDGHILLLQTLKSAFFSESKKPQSIKFQGDEPTEIEENVVPVQETDTACGERYTHNLNDVVEKVCCSYFEYVDKRDVAEPVLLPLITILKEFDSSSLYTALATQFGASGPLALYETVLKRWLLRDTTRCRAVVDVTFLLLKHLTDDEQDLVMASFDQLGGGVVEWCLSLALCHTQWGVGAARRWLRGGVVQRALLALARRLLRQRCQRARTLLLVSLTADIEGEMLISEETASKIAEVVSDALCSQFDAPVAEAAEDEEQPELEHFAVVAAQLATALAPRAGHPPLAQDLLRLLLRVPRGSPRLSLATWCEVRSAAHDALAALPPALRAAPDAPAALLPQRLRTLVDEVDFTEIEHMALLCPFLISGGSGPSAVAEVVALVKTLLAPLRRAYTDIEVLALRHDCVAGRLNCPLDDTDELIRAVVAEAESDSPAELTKAQLVPFANALLFRAMCLRTLLLPSPEHDAPEGPGCDELLADEYIQMEFCALLRETMIIFSLERAYGYWTHHDIIKQTKTKLDAIITEIVAASSPLLRVDLLSRLAAYAAGLGYYWAYARRYCEVLAHGAGEPPTFLAGGLDAARLERMLTGNGYFHGLQANSYWSADCDSRVQCAFAVAARSVLSGFEQAREGDHFTGGVLATATSKQNILDPLVDFYHRHDQVMLYERDIMCMPWREVVAEAGALECAAAWLAAGGWGAPREHWDYATVTVAALLANLRRAAKHCNTTKVAMLARPALKLFAFIQQFVASVRSESERQQPSEHVAALPDEWRDVFAAATNRDLYTLSHALLDTSCTTMGSNMSVVLAGLAAGVRGADWQLLDLAQRNGDLALPLLVQRACATLAQPLPPPPQVLAHATLCALAEPLVVHDAEQLSSWSVESDAQRPPLAPDWYHDHFSQALTLLDALLADYTPCEETCELPVGSAEQAAARGAILLADALHHLTRRAIQGLAHHYTQMYRDGRYVELLLPAALRLLPAELLAAALAPNTAPLPLHYTGAFHIAPQLPANDGGWHRSTGALACRGVMVCVGGAGVCGARGWWGAAGRKGRPLARIVAAYIAPGLVRAQLDHLHRHRDDVEDGTEVRIHWAAREAVAEFVVEERRVELWLRFDAEYPLSLPRVRAPVPRPAVPTGWIAMYLAYQHGTVLNAIKMWTAAIGARVEAAPQCYVCYCRLHPSTGHLPNVPCHQCKNRFHTACLHKWFVSSHRSNCPLCRSSF